MSVSVLPATGPLPVVAPTSPMVPLWFVAAVLRNAVCGAAYMQATHVAEAQAREEWLAVAIYSTGAALQRAFSLEALLAMGEAEATRAVTAVVVPELPVRLAHAS